MINPAMIAAEACIPAISQPHIAPTVGRVVWYWPAFGDGDRNMDHDGEQPCRADVCHVNPDGSINLCVNDAAGNGFKRPNITLHQGDAEGCSLPRPFATWMPYQKQVAAKAEAAEKTAHLGSATDTANELVRLQVEMQRELVRELRLKNDAQELNNCELLGRSGKSVAAETHARLREFYMRTAPKPAEPLLDADGKPAELT